MSQVRAPRVLAIVLNGVVEDSRVLKCAYSAGEAGWDSLILGTTRNGSKDQFEVGRARVLRVPAKAPVGTGLLAKVLRRGRYYVARFKFHFLPAKPPAIPGLGRAVATMTPYALAFAPDVIHAHDYSALPVADALADAISSSGGVRPKVIYDAHEFLQGTQHLSPSAHEAFSTAELQIAQKIDAMFVVSPQMGPMLKEYLKIGINPAVVANDPISQGRRESTRSLRTDAGLAEGIPLMVYSGAVAPQRGLGTVLDALPSLPGVALVIIAAPSNVYVKELMARAASMGLSDRVKNVAYVPNEELVSYLSAADIGLIPLLHRPNHEISLITKFGEYAAANLPIIVSDVKTMAAEVRTIGNGEVFTAENASEFVVAAKRILADPAKYRAAYTDEVLRTRSWERQSETLIATYNGLVSDRAVEVKPSTPLPFTLTKPHSLSGPNDARSAEA